MPNFKNFSLVFFPLTNKIFLKFGIECPENYGDPGLLMPLVYKPYTNSIKYCVGILPHYVDKTNLNNITSYLDNNKISYVILDIMSAHKAQYLVNQVCQCEYLITSSLHGIILGIAYNIKTIWVKFSNRVTGKDFKFYDFFSSLNINYTPVNINENLFNNYLNVDKSCLSNLGSSMIELLPFFSSNDLRKQRIIEWEKLIDTY